MKLSKSISQSIPTIVGFLFIVLFVYAATSKFIDFENFNTQLGQSPILTAFADFVAWFIPSIEYIIAGIFLIPKFNLLAFKMSFSLMVMFTTYIVLVLNFSDYIPCSCGGVLETLGWTEHIIFNLVFVLLAVLSILIKEGNIKSKKGV